MDRVRADIIQSLNLQNAFTAISSFDRPNIFYGVKGLSRTAAFREELAREILNDVGKSGSTIIYCTTVNDVDEVINLKLGGKTRFIFSISPVWFNISIHLKSLYTSVVYVCFWSKVLAG